ncbi:hypothetical protein [Paraburkholderia sp.]|uniref:hypothetical protein n=1 Tax=Paraburkholderia sp. TaxID=1926495 RepID=UPI0025D216C4|nr:hypothetical protein [Paraburkholderia sp.]
MGELCLWPARRQPATAGSFRVNIHMTLCEVQKATSYSGEEVSAAAHNEWLDGGCLLGTLAV